jgi:predicted metal-dependent peptidase
MSKIPKSLAKQLEKGAGVSGGVDEHMYPQPGDHISEEELQRAEDEWKQRAINAAERARQAGKLPAGMERFFGEILEPQVDWRTVMYQFITGGLPCGRTWIRRDRRYAAHGFYIPDQKRESTDIFAWVDTSGSIADKEISQFKTELIGAKRAFESLKLSLGFCDDKVYEPVLEFDQVEESDIMKAKPRGGGGTDMRKCVKYVMDKHPETEVVVILTDGYTPFPTRAEVPNNMRILWIICPGGITKEHIANDNIAGDFVFMKRE